MKTPATRPVLVAAGIFAACAAGGWLAGGGLRASSEGKAADDAEAKPTKARRDLRQKAAVPAEVTARMAAVRAARDTDERLRATIQLAYSLPLAEIEAWWEAEWFDGREDMQSYFFYRITRARWMEADPAGLMDYCLREDSTHTHQVAGAWARRDPGGALAYLREARDPARLSRLLSAMGGALAKADPAAALESVSAFRATLPYGDNYGLHEIIREVAKSAPGLLEAQSADWPPALRHAMASSLASAALNRDLAGTAAKLAESKDGKRHFMEALDQDRDLVKRIARDPSILPEGWFGELASRSGYYIVEDDPRSWVEADLATMGFSEDQARQLRSYALNQLGNKDPAYLQTLLTGGNLEPNERRDVIGRLVNSMAADKEKAEAWIAGLTDESDIEIAKGTLAVTSSPEVTPSTLLSDLSGGASTLDWNQARAAALWGPEERNAFTRGFSDLPPEQKEATARKLLQSHYQQFPDSLRAEAIGYLLAEPPAEAAKDAPSTANDGFVQAASTVAARWVDDDPAAASCWVGSLPAGEARLWAAKNLAARWNDYEPAASSRWIDSLPASEKAEVRKYVDSGQAHRH